jgi:Mg2+ and Co2+ transporter CorA
LYDADGHDREIAVTPGVRTTLTDRQLLWVDVLSSDREELSRLCEAVALPRAAGKLAFGEKGPLGLIKFDGFMHVTVVALHFTGPEEWKPVRTSLLWDRQVVLTAHPTEVDAFQGFAAHDRGETHIGALSADVFLSALFADRPSCANGRTTQQAARSI